MKCRFSIIASAMIAMLIASSCKRALPDNAGCATDIEKSAKPVIVAVESEFDFGKVKQGAEVEHVFKIRNDGNKDLVIERAAASCGCVATVTTRDPIPPGKEGEIKAVFRTAGKRGILAKRITVFSNDPTNPRLPLTLKAEITLDVEVVPATLSFKEVMLEKTATLTAELRIAEPDRVKVTSVTSDDPRFTVKLVPGNDPKKLAMEVAFLGSKVEERVSSTLHIAASGTDAKGSDVSVWVQTVGNLRYPKQIHLMKVGEVFNTREIEIVSRTKTPFTIKRVVDKSGRLKLDFSKKPGDKIRLVASVLNPKMPVESPIQGTIELTTSDPVNSKIEIGYTISHRQDAAQIRERVMRARKGGPGQSIPPKAEDNTDTEPTIPII